MEKKTVLFVALSTVIFIGFYFLQNYLYPPEKQETVQSSGDSDSAPDSAGTGRVLPAQNVPDDVIVNDAVDEIAVQPSPAAEEDRTEETQVPAESRIPESVTEEQIITVETDLLRVALTNAGGDMVSYQLMEHKDKDESVEMVLGGSAESHAFTIAFGGLDAAPVTSLFRVKRSGENRDSPQVVEFSRNFSVSGGGSFTLTKRYDFRPGEYMFELTVSLDSASSTPLNVNGAAYTLGFGPQIGPRFEKLDNRYEYRHYYVFGNNKRRQVKADELIDSRFTWAGIAGKYFTAMVVPDNTLYQLSFSAKAEDGLPAASRFYMVRPALPIAKTTDVYHFYLGPKNQENLGRYDTGINSFGMKDLQFIKASNTSGFLSPLENLLKLLLQFFHGLIPGHNYGVAIILLTLLVKIVLFPLTKKSSEASIKMQALAPKIKELQAKYKDNPAKLNTEMAALYKKEGHNPMSGCLPMLIQLPLLWAMYNLFNTHFDLRGAMFIPHWIPDLSLPEAIWTFGSSLPLLGWNSLRLLPFIYLGSQLLYGLVTRTPEQQGNSSMAMMMYVMPIMFFFILYDVPSGLLVFWIFSNLFTLVQQLALNKIMAKKRLAAAAVEEREPVIAPRRKKKR